MFWRVSWQKIKYWSKILIVVFICYFIYRAILYKLGISERMLFGESMANMFKTWTFWKETPPCSEIQLSFTGEFEPDIKNESLEVVEERLAHLLQPGGYYTPKQCKAIERVALITPIRNRENHLPIFLKNLHSHLMKQNIEYQMFVVEQTPGQPFNRGTMFNVGYVEAMKLKQWDCIIFHDVDLIPINDRNLYKCSKTNPKRYAVMVDNDNYEHMNLFGGVTALTPKQFEKVNGHSNLFWGWGNEDNDFLARVHNANYKTVKYPAKIAKYIMLKHKPMYRNADANAYLYYTGYKHFKDNGLSNLKYHIKNYQLKTTYTWFLVDIIPEELGGKSVNIDSMDENIQF